MSLEPEPLLGAFDRAVRPVRRPNPLVLAWRWRYEIGAGVAAVFLLPWLTDRPPAVIAGILTVTALLLAVPPTRRVLWRRLRIVYVQHRVRTAFRAWRVHSNTGRLPSILWASPRQHADRLLLALPAGVTAGFVAEHADEIAVACEGAYAEVLPVGRFRSVVRLVIVRR